MYPQGLVLSDARSYHETTKPEHQFGPSISDGAVAIHRAGWGRENMRCSRTPPPRRDPVILCGRDQRKPHRLSGSPEKSLRSETRPIGEGVESELSAPADQFRPHRRKWRGWPEANVHSSLWPFADRLLLKENREKQTLVGDRFQSTAIMLTFSGRPEPDRTARVPPVQSL